MCAVEKVVCGCVLHRGQRGERWCVLSTLCRYDIRMGFIVRFPIWLDFPLITLPLQEC